MPAYEEIVDRVQNRRPLNLEVDDYMTRQTPAYQATVDDACGQLLDQSTPSFLARKNTKVGYAMPIAVDEDRYIEHTLEQYALQEQPGRHRLLGYLNWTEEESQYQIDRTHDILEGFIGSHPEVPFAFFEGPIEEPLAIGGLRKLVSETLLVYSADSRTDDMLIVGEDADLEWMDPHHTRTLGNRFTGSKQPVTGIIPHSRYGRTPNLPNMDMVVSWQDDWDVSWAIRNYFEPGPGFSARGMMAANGYDPKCRLGETHILMDEIHGGSARRNREGCLWVAEAVLVMSARRPYEKMYQGAPTFWSENEPMTSDEAYRELDSRHFTRWPDISEQDRDARLRNYIETWLQEYTEFSSARSLGMAFRDGVVFLEGARKRLGGPDNIVFDTAKSMVRIVPGDPSNT